MRLRAVIFDLYGTLLSRPCDRTPYTEVFRAASRTPAESQRIAITCHLPTLADFAAAAVGCPDLPELEHLQSRLDVDLGTVRPFPDAEPTVRQLRELGIKTSVVSNLATPYRDALPRSLADLLDSVVFSCDAM